MLPLVLSFLSPILLLIIGYLSSLKSLNRKKLINLRKTFLILLISLFLFYPMIVKCSISLNCIQLDKRDYISQYQGSYDYNQNFYFLLNSPNLKCWESDHATYVSIVGFIGIFLWGFCFPIVLASLIKRNRKKNSIEQIPKKDKENIPNKRKTKIKLEEHQNKLFSFKNKNEPKVENNLKSSNEKNDISVFFVKDYKTQFYYWESIIFLTKFFLSFLPNLSAFLTNEQMNFIYFIIFFLYFLMVFFSSPFKIERINMFEKSSIGICVLTRLLMQMSTDAYFTNNIQMILYSISLGMNFIFYGFAGYLMFKLTEWKKLYIKFHKKTSSLIGRARSLTTRYGISSGKRSDNIVNNLKKKIFVKNSIYIEK